MSSPTRPLPQSEAPLGGICELCGQALPREEEEEQSDKQQDNRPQTTPPPPPPRPAHRGELEELRRDNARLRKSRESAYDQLDDALEELDLEASDADALRTRLADEMRENDRLRYLRDQFRDAYERLERELLRRGGGGELEQRGLEVVREEEDRRVYTSGSSNSSSSDDQDRERRPRPRRPRRRDFSGSGEDDSGSSSSSSSDKPTDLGK